MNQMNPNNYSPGGKRSPIQVVTAFTNYIRAGIMLTIWVVLGSLAAGIGYVCIRGILVAVRMCLDALGI